MTVEQLQELLRAAVPDACRVLRETMEDASVKPELRVKCCEIVFDRVFGRAPPDAQCLSPVVFVGGDTL